MRIFKEAENLRRLCHLLDEMGEKASIVFVNTKRTADSLSRQLCKHGYGVTIQGSMTQDQREVRLDAFRKKGFNCLVATDVAGCSIDVPDVAHVINYGMPN